jgi:hypothetical protein
VSEYGPLRSAEPWGGKKKSFVLVEWFVGPSPSRIPAEVKGNNRNVLDKPSPGALGFVTERNASVRPITFTFTNPRKMHGRV